MGENNNKGCLSSKSSDEYKKCILGLGFGVVKRKSMTNQHTFDIQSYYFPSQLSQKSFFFFLDGTSSPTSQPLPQLSLPCGELRGKSGR